MINPTQLLEVFNVEFTKWCLKSILKDVSVAKYMKKIIDSKDDTRTNICIDIFIFYIYIVPD